MNITKYILFIASLLLLSACTTSGSECVDNNDCLPTHYCANSGGVLFESGICTIRSSPASPQTPADNTDIVEDTDFDFDADNFSDTPLIADDFDAESPFTNDATLTEESDTTAQTEPDALQGNECLVDSECIPSLMGKETIWSACTFLDACSNSGQQTRQSTTYQCQNGFCQSQAITEHRDCVRDTTGELCSEEEPATIWNACQYEDECSKTGIRYGTIPYVYCKEGTCSDSQPMSVESTERCDRITVGNHCTTLSGLAGTCTNSGSCLSKLIPVDPGLEPI